MGPGPVRCTGLPSGVPKALRSAPAQKVPLSPHSTAIDADSSLSNSSKAANRFGGGRSVDGVARLRPVHDDSRDRAAAFDSHSLSWPPSVRVRSATPPIRRRIVHKPRAARCPASRRAAVRQAAPGRSAGGEPYPRRRRTAPGRRSRPPCRRVDACRCAPRRADPTTGPPIRAGSSSNPRISRTRRSRSSGSAISRLSGRSHTPSRSSANLLCCRVVRRSARVRASMPTLVMTSVVQPPSHDLSCGLMASSWRRCRTISRSDSRYPSSDRTRSPAPTIRVSATRSVASLMSKSAVSRISSAAVAHAGWAPSSTLSTTERAVIRLSAATVRPRTSCGPRRRRVRRGSSRPRGSPCSRASATNA